MIQYVKCGWAENWHSPDNSIFRDINFLLLSLAFRLVLLQMEAEILLIDGGNNNVTDGIFLSALLRKCQQWSRLASISNYNIAQKIVIEVEKCNS